MVQKDLLKCSAYSQLGLEIFVLIFGSRNNLTLKTHSKRALALDLEYVLALQ
jgi:hypothetical protein